MKKTILFLAFIMALISFDALAGVDSLLYEINPSLTQRGVRVPNWKETNQYINLGMMKYQVITDTTKQETFAILNQVDTALKGSVVIPQYIHSEDGNDLEVRGLGLYAFYLGRVSEVTLPESVEYIGDCAFYRCYGLEKLNIPEKVHTIGNWALVYTALDSIRFPENLAKLGELRYGNALDNENHYRNVKYIYFGKNIKDINTKVERDGYTGGGRYHAYPELNQHFPALETIDVSPDNEVYYSNDGVLYEKEKNAFCIYPRGKKDKIYRMPDNVTLKYNSQYDDLLWSGGTCTEIRNDHLQVIKLSDAIDTLQYGFINKCKNIKTVIMPLNLKRAFRFCSFSLSQTSYGSPLRSIYVQNPIPWDSNHYEYKGDDNKKPIYNATLFVPRGCLEAYKTDPVWKHIVKEIKEYDTIDYSTDDNDDSSFDELYADNDHAVIEGNTVRIVSNDHKSPAYIYDMQGRVIFAGTNREFTINRKGIFLLRFNNLSKKFIIR